MSLYAIGDLHLSTSTNKPMDVFGPAWENYTRRIIDGFSAFSIKTENNMAFNSLKNIKKPS